MLVLGLEKKISPEFNPKIAVGYHGTSIKRAELALTNKELLVSRDDSGDWLAEGAYFWEDSLDMAQRWAQERHGNMGAVLRAEIRLGRCLNLMDSKWNDALEAGYKEVEANYKRKREQTDARQTLVKETCRKRGIDLYLPKDKTDPELHKNIPAEDVFFADIQQVLSSDLLILMTEHPSFGGGMELKTALDAQLPILLISPRDARISRMVLGIPSTRSYEAKYSTDEELRSELEKALSFLKQSMTDRKDSLKTIDNTVGTSIKKNREKSGFNREQLAATIGTTTEALTRLEESPDYLTNLSLLGLRKLAQVLGMRVSDIVDPEFVAVVGLETLKLAQDTDLLVKARQSNGKVPLEDQFSIIRVALEERLTKKKPERPGATA